VEGDPLAMIEAMKMRRHILSPERGVVKEIMAKEGEIVDPQDVLIVVG
jgi:biotin carboxyl carrier protein